MPDVGLIKFTENVGRAVLPCEVKTPEVVLNFEKDRKSGNWNEYVNLFIFIFFYPIANYKGLGDKDYVIVNI